MAELSAYWKGDNTYKLSKEAHNLAKEVKRKDPVLGDKLDKAIAALDKNADEMLAEALATTAKVEALEVGVKALETRLGL